MKKIKPIFQADPAHSYRRFKITVMLRILVILFATLFIYAATPQTVLAEPEYIPCSIEATDSILEKDKDCIIVSNQDKPYVSIVIENKNETEFPTNIEIVNLQNTSKRLGIVFQNAYDIEYPSYFKWTLLLSEEESLILHNYGQSELEYTIRRINA